MDPCGPPARDPPARRAPPQASATIATCAANNLRPEEDRYLPARRCDSVAPASRSAALAVPLISLAIFPPFFFFYSVFCCRLTVQRSCSAVHTLRRSMVLRISDPRLRACGQRDRPPPADLPFLYRAASHARTPSPLSPLWAVADLRKSPRARTRPVRRGGRANLERNSHRAAGRVAVPRPPPPPPPLRGRRRLEGSH